MNALQQQAMDRVGENDEPVFGLGEPSGPAPDIFESMGLVKPDLGSLSIRTAPTPQEPSSISGGGDRELLERAAKAAGIEGHYARVHQTYGDQWIEGINTSGPIFWNPLVDDGDALRLAVELGLTVNAGTHSVSRNGGLWFGQVGQRDAHAATRRAIVRAAASLTNPTEVSP